MGGAGMCTGPGDGGALAAPSDAVRAELKEILASKGFAQSERLSRFLKLVVEKVITGQPDLNEYSIGVDVFDKKTDFDPRIDPIVRVHARRLRERLRQYYTTEGLNDPIEIDLPVRSYVPSIRKRLAPVIVGPHLPLWSEAPEAANSVAVLPFTSLSSEKEDEYFARGLTQELIHALVGVTDLRVVSPSCPDGDSQAARWPDVRELGKQHRVQAVLEGTIRRTERHARVSVQLISVADGSVLWSKMYEAESGSIPSQEQLARAICGELSGSVNRTGTNAPRAHQLFLQAKYQCDKRTRGGLEKCVAYLTAALEADPKYAAAHAALAEAFVLMAVHGEAPPGDMMPQAKASALRALKYDESRAEAHVLLGIVAAMYEWDLPGAEAEFLSALEMAPNSPHALNWFSIVCLTPSGRFDEAIAHLTCAQDIDPLSLTVATSLGYTLAAAGRTEDGLACLLQAIDLEPGFPMTRWALGLVYQQLGNVRNAIAEFEAACDLSGRMAFALGSLGHVCAVSGGTERALQVLNILHQQRKHFYVPALDIGLIYAGLRQPSEALAWFDRAYDERCAWLSRIRVDPRLRTLRTEEQFARILRKIGAQPLSGLSVSSGSRFRSGTPPARR